jgi:hypothetical protein
MQQNWEEAQIASIQSDAAKLGRSTNRIDPVCKMPKILPQKWLEESSPTR